MIENINDKVHQILEDRLLALNQKKGAEDTKVQIEEEIRVLEEYLFGNGTDAGIISLLELYAKEFAYLRASTFSKPNLAVNSSSAWKERFALAVRIQGDDSTGFYPPDEYEIGAEDLNVASIWLTNNGYSEGSGGLFPQLENLESARNALWEKRTEVYPQGHENEGMVINPDYFLNPEKDNLLNKLTSISSYLETYVDNYLSVLKNVVDKIKLGNNYFFNYLDMKEDVVAFSQSLITQINSYKTFYDDAHEYLSTVVSSSTSRTKMNEYLSPSSTKVERSLVMKDSEIRSFINTRTATLKNLMGFDDLTSGIRKWMFFFIKLLIQKPVSPYGSLEGVEKSIFNAEKTLNNYKEFLDTLFGETDKYLPTPKMVTAYVMPDENAVNGNKVDLIIQTIPSVPVMTIYRKQISHEDVLNNNPWAGSTLLDTVESEKPVLVYSDKTIPERTGQLLLYRISLQDQGTYRIDNYNSGSLQSDVLGEPISFTRNSDYELEILDHDFSTGEIFYIEGGGVYKVLSFTQNTLTVDRIISSSGSLQRVFGAVHLSEEE